MLQKGKSEKEKQREKKEIRNNNYTINCMDG